MAELFQFVDTYISINEYNCFWLWTTTHMKKKAICGLCHLLISISTNLYSCHGPVRNPWSSSHSVTGTDWNDRVVSGGSAVAVASGMVDL